MDMIEVKTADLIGPALDWAVATAEGREIALDVEGGVYVDPYDAVIVLGRGKKREIRERLRATKWNPSTDWSQGGPLLDKHCKGLGLVQDGCGSHWQSFAYNVENRTQRLGDGETILIAFCRALVRLHFGEAVEVPAALVLDQQGGAP